jgi:serine/threonine protein kinase
VTQREAPGGLPPGIEDEEEERTTVGSAPSDMGALPPNTPQPFGPPPKVSYGKHNTPTAFTPQGAQNQGGAQGGGQKQPAPQSDRRPAMPRQPGGSPTIRQPDGQRTSSGPQPLHSPGTQTPQMTPMTPMGPPGQAGPGQSGMMPFVQSGGGPVPQGQTPGGGQNRNELSFAGPSPLGQAPGGQGGQGNTNAIGGGLNTGGAGMAPSGHQPLGVRADQQPMANRAAAFHITRSRAYSFVLDARGTPIELGSGRFAKVFLGEERWLESKTDFRRPIVIKILQKGVSEDDHMRFQMEKELLERVQGHPNIVELFASGEADDPSFLPPSIRDKCDTEFMILEKLDMSLEERLKGSRNRGAKEDLLACDMRERLFRVLDYMIPIASGVEYAHLVRNICHRDIKPANVLVGLPDPNLRGSTLQVRLADFNVAKLSDEEVNFGMTRMKAAVPGTLFFQSPEQETNILELLVNVQQGLPEVEYFEDFYIQISKNDSFSLFNRNENYPVLYADRARKRLVLGRPYREPSETNVRARIQKSVGRPADIYSLGATFYYLISGAYANPKTLYDAFHKFIEYERADENNTIESYLRHEYSVINSLRAPKAADGSPEVAPADRFFSYKHYLDGNGELIDPNVMLIIAKCMIRNKPDSYCQAHDLETRGISDLVSDLINLYSLYGFQPGARPTHLVHRTNAKRGMLKGRVGSRLRMMWLSFLGIFRKKPK